MSDEHAQEIITLLKQILVEIKKQREALETHLAGR